MMSNQLEGDYSLYHKQLRRHLTCSSLPIPEEFCREFRGRYWRFPKIARLIRRPGEKRRGRGAGGDKHRTRVMLDKSDGFFFESYQVCLQPRLVRHHAGAALKLRQLVPRNLQNTYVSRC